MDVVWATYLKGIVPLLFFARDICHPVPKLIKNLLIEYSFRLNYSMVATVPLILPEVIEFVLDYNHLVSWWSFVRVNVLSSSWATCVLSHRVQRSVIYTSSSTRSCSCSFDYFPGNSATITYQCRLASIREYIWRTVTLRSSGCWVKRVGTCHTYHNVNRIPYNRKYWRSF